MPTGRRRKLVRGRSGLKRDRVWAAKAAGDKPGGRLYRSGRSDCHQPAIGERSKLLLGLVQEYKEIAIVEKAGGKIYVGDDARTLLGLPIGARIKVRAGDHAGFAVYVQSTSVNRRLVAGTTLLYRK